jgi:hypothetical protein
VRGLGDSCGGGCADAWECSPVAVTVAVNAKRADDSIVRAWQLDGVMLFQMTKDVRTVTAPDGRRFAIFLGAPGSLLDAGLDQPSGGQLGLVVGRASRRGWRLDVEPLSPDWHLGAALHRERVADEEQAEKRSAELAAFINSGAWDPETRRAPPPSLA